MTNLEIFQICHGAMQKNELILPHQTNLLTYFKGDCLMKKHFSKLLLTLLLVFTFTSQLNLPGWFYGTSTYKAEECTDAGLMIRP